MSRGILTDLAIKLSADAAELNSGLRAVNAKMGKFESGLQKTASFIPKAFGALAVGEFVRQIGVASIELMRMKENVANFVKGAANIDIVTGKIKALSTVFKVDMNRVLEASNTLVQQTGVNWYESLELIQKGLALSGSSREEFLNQIREYAPFIKEAGGEAKDLIAIITNGFNAGVWNDKAADAIKEGILSLREMTTATATALDSLGFNSAQISKEINNGTLSIFDALQKVSQRMSELPPDSKQVGMAMADIFKGAGEDAGYKFLTSFKNGFNINEAIAGSELAQAKIRLTEAASEVATIWSNALGKDSTWWQNFKADITGLSGDVLKGFLTALGQADYVGMIENIQLASKEKTTDGVQEIIDDILGKIKEVNRKLETDYGIDIFGKTLFDLPAETRAKFENELKYLTDQYEAYRKKLQVLKADVGKAPTEPTAPGGVTVPKSLVPTIDQTELIKAGVTIGEILSQSAKSAFDREWQKGGYLFTTTGYWLTEDAGLPKGATDALSYWEELNLKMSSTQQIASSLTGMFSALGEGIGVLASKEANAAQKIGATASTIAALVSQYMALMAAKIAAADSDKGFPLNVILAAAGLAGMMSLIAPFIKKRATGGPTSGLTLVGERGPELFDGSGYVYNSQRTKSMMGGGGGGTVIFQISGDSLMGVLQRNQIKIDQFS